jgi:hypothetical protein
MDRVRQAYRDGIIFCGIFTVAMTGILFVLREPIISLFGADGVTRDLLVLFCGPLALAFFFSGVIYVSNAAFNNMGHPFRSTAINWGLHTVGTIPLVVAGARLFGAAGVLIGQALAGVIFAGVATLMVRRMMDSEAPAANPVEPFDREARLMSSWIQVASATPGLKASISSAIASAGVLQPRVFLGRLFSSAATSFSHV